MKKKSSFEYYSDSATQYRHFEKKKRNWLFFKDVNISRRPTEEHQGMGGSVRLILPVERCTAQTVSLSMAEFDFHHFQPQVNLK